MNKKIIVAIIAAIIVVTLIIVGFVVIVSAGLVGAVVIEQGNYNNELEIKTNKETIYEMFDNFPESNNLSWSYCEYIISRDSFEPKLYYEYSDNLSELNNLMLTPIPITKLTKEQAYRIEYEGLNKDDFKTILDSKGMLNNFILEYRKKNANNFVNIQIDE